jgi:hypothetical protein
MSEPLQQMTLWPSADVSTSSQADSRVRTSALPGKALASTVRGAACFSSYSALSLNCGHLGCSLRTYLRSSLAAMTGLPTSWKLSATPSGRLWPALGRAERPIGEIASGLSDIWTTPCVRDAESLANVTRGAASLAAG